ncbi:MAG: hypothetical protein SV686_01985 [Thermodesulfobacteriota bacterium]|jgi:hypothetical protein|nr:hypothetical protein [Thermodesulfobacteriota bacterium]
MRRISEQLSSLHFTTWTVVVLILWFSGGILLAGHETYSREFALMNRVPLRHWIVDPLQGSFLIKSWFVGLCLVMVILGVNLVFCSWTKIMRIIRIRLSASKLLMLVIHIVFGLVALGHFGSFMLGYRHENIRLAEGEIFSFGEDYELALVKVHFVDEPWVLDKSRRELTRNQFHYRSNFAEVMLSRKQKKVDQDRIHILRPFRHKNIQITLKRFIPLSTRAQSKGNDNAPVGVVLVVSKNPVIWIFLTLYPLMILGIMIYMLMTWRISSHSTNSKEYSEGGRENERENE